MRYGSIFLLFVLAACSGLEILGVEIDPPAPTQVAEPTANIVESVETLPATPEPSHTPPAPTAAETAAAVEPQAPLVIESEPPPAAAGIQDASAYTWLPVASGLEKPIEIAFARDGSGRLFVLEQPGRIRIIQGDVLQLESFLDITDRVGSGGSEQGLLGLAFHPQFAENGFFFVNYTDLQGDTVIARFQVSDSDPNRALKDSEVRLMRISQPYRNHNGGAVLFGPDGALYLGLGDGGSAGDPQNNGQSLDSLLGKILRIDVDRGDPYAIPEDNPLASANGKPEIFAYGLRNPWRMSFDRLTGDLYIGDVGQNQWEEISYLSAGQIREPVSGQPYNFGWVFYEGTHPYSGTPPVGMELIPPIIEYSHQFGCSVTGGVVYRGSSLPEWQGIYLFGDYCTGTVWGAWKNSTGNWESRPLFENVGRITSFGEDEPGEVYLADHAGWIYRLAEK